MSNLDLIKQRLQALRTYMAANDLQACVIPTADPHLSEYLPDYWQARVWLSGFDGSAGTLLISHDFAGLWTDSRYWVQAEHQLKDTGIQLMRLGAADVHKPLDWLINNLHASDNVAIDANVFDYASCKSWLDSLGSLGINLVLDKDPVAEIWLDRPGLPSASIYQHKPPFACRSIIENLTAIRQSMAENGAQWHFISSLDDIAWILNLRGADVDYNPIFLSHLLIGLESACLYVDKTKLSDEIKIILSSNNIQVLGYQDFSSDLAAIDANDTILIDPNRVTYGSLDKARHLHIVTKINPSQLLKSIKNKQEAAHIRETMRQDGAALCEFFAWFENALANGQKLTEIDVDTHLSAARARRTNFVSLSFPTIAGFNSNGAMPHYQATADSYADIVGDGLLLIDSGGQYLGGTTDITRVVPIGKPNHDQCADYTLVLKSHINLAMAKFPVGTQSASLDILARTPLWQSGLDYGHGTGHGVGYFLNVHEGPQSISFRAYARAHQEMLAGMLTSNEPGLYRDGKWGIRIESLVLTVPYKTTEFGEFLGFETVTLCPINTKCIIKDMLSDAEIRWLNDYHQMVREKLQDLLDENVRNWLIENTQAL